MSTLIRTDEVPAADRLEFVRQMTATTWVPMECRSDFHADYWGSSGPTTSRCARCTSSSTTRA